MNIYNKVNRSIADAAAKVMESQPAKVQDYKAPQQLDSSMVEKVLASGLKTKLEFRKNDK
jgi:hypothetical protein